MSSRLFVLPATDHPPGRHRAPSSPRRISRTVRALVIAVVSGAMLFPASGIASATPTKTIVAVVRAHPTLQYGSKGIAVQWVQRYLHVRPVSGWFGPKTKAAVVRFQRAHHIKATGVVTSPTWRAMNVRYTARPAARASRAGGRAMIPGTAFYGARVLSIAKSTAKGARYGYGGRGPKRFDCSGYVGYVMRTAGVSLPRDSRGMRAATTRISKSQVRPGDLVFVHRGGRVSHVAIYAGKGVWYEASNPRTGVGKHRAWTSRVSYGRVR